MHWLLVFSLSCHFLIPSSFSQSQETSPLLPLPSTILLHASDNYSGETIPVECCGDVEVDNSFKINSVRMAPGLLMHLFTESTCTGLSLRSTINIASIGQHHAELNGNIRCLRILRVAPDSGIIIWQHPNEKGEGQFLFPGSYSYNANQLYWRDISSITIPSGYRVHVTNGPTPISSPSTDHNIQYNSFTSTQSTLGDWDNLITSIIVEVTCTPSCIHGTCILPNTCDCLRGWDGDICDIQVIDTSSVVWCTYDEILVGEYAPCAVWTRSRASTAVTTSSAFTLQVDNKYGTIQPTWSNTVTSTFPFHFIASISALSTPQHPRQSFFTAHITPSHASLFVPTLAVFDTPDITSIITCTKTHLLQGESTTCTITPQRDNALITTLARVFDIKSNSKGSITHIRSTGTPNTNVTPIEQSVQGGKKRKAKNSAWSEKVGQGFSFRYTALTPGNFAARINVTIISCRTPPCPPIHLSLPKLHHHTPRSNDYLAHAKQSMFRFAIYDAMNYLRRALQQKHIQHIVETMVLRASIRLLLGHWTRVARDWDMLEAHVQGTLSTFSLSERDTNDDGVDRYHLRDTLLHTPHGDAKTLTTTIKQQRNMIRHARGLQSAGTVSHAMQQWGQAVASLSDALEIAKFSDELHLLRAHAAIQMDNYMMVRHDVQHVLAHTPYHDMALLLLSQASFRIIGKLDVAITNIRYCIHMTSSSICRMEYDLLYEIQNRNDAYIQAWKTRGNYTYAISSLQHEMSLVQNYNKRVMTYGRIRDPSTSTSTSPSTSMGPFLLHLIQQYCLLHHDATHVNTVTVCSAAIRDTLMSHTQDDSVTTRDPALLSLYIARGWAHLRASRFEAAMNDVKSANELGWGDSKIEELRNEIVKEQEAVKPRNLYEILGVALESTLTELKRAYRKLSLFYHPDKNSSPEAAAMFLQVQEAFNVLSDENLRSRYDAGQDMKDARQHAPKQEAPVFHHDGMTEDGRIRAWFMNEDGEQEWTEMETEESRKKEETKRQQHPQPEPQKPMPKHCCLPWDG